MAISEEQRAQEQQEKREAIKQALITTYTDIGDVIAESTGAYANRIKTFEGNIISVIEQSRMISEFGIALTWKLINPQMQPRENRKAK